MSAFFEATRQEYYDRLLAVSLQSRWEPWLAYFFNGIARRSEDVLDHAVRINTLLQEWREALAGQKPKILYEANGLLAENPYWTMKRLAERLFVAFTTTQRAVRVLEEMEILTQSGNAKRDRVYCANDILQILNEPPQDQTSIDSATE